MAKATGSKKSSAKVVVVEQPKGRGSALMSEAGALYQQAQLARHAGKVAALVAIATIQETCPLDMLRTGRKEGEPRSIIQDTRVAWFAEEIGVNFIREAFRLGEIKAQAGKRFPAGALLRKNANRTDQRDADIWVGEIDGACGCHSVEWFEDYAIDNGAPCTLVTLCPHAATAQVMQLERGKRFDYSKYLPVDFTDKLNGDFWWSFGGEWADLTKNIGIHLGATTSEKGSLVATPEIMAAPMSANYQKGDRLVVCWTGSAFELRWFQPGVQMAFEVCGEGIRSIAVGTCTRKEAAASVATPVRARQVLPVANKGTDRLARAAAMHFVAKGDWPKNWAEAHEALLPRAVEYVAELSQED